VRKLLAAFAVMLIWVPIAAANPQKDAVVTFLQLREKTLDQRGTAADVDKLLALLSDNAVYEHPASGIVMDKAQARSGLLAHLNEGRNATYTIRRSRFGKDFAIVEITLDYTVERKQMKRTGAFVFEFDGHKISRVAVYTN
jgi:ketosteroid isomerase-like protein